MKLPKARNENIVVQSLNDETLVYDLTTNQAFCLNETSAKVFEFCDGTRTFAELKAAHQFTDDLIFLALDGLKKENLIESDYASPFAGTNRREVIKRVGLATMIALPVISAMVAPKAVHAASVSIAACRSCSLANNQCASGRCAVRTRPAGVNGSYCSAASDPAITLLPGDAFGANSVQECNTQAAQYCCAGNGATYNSKPGVLNPCTCNA